MSGTPKILFVAGDPSGDQHAAAVARAIKARFPRAEISAVGGPALKSAADHFLHDLVGESVMGFVEPLAKLPRFWRLLRGVVAPAAVRPHGAPTCREFVAPASTPLAIVSFPPPPPSR